jgi:hypothetical protein
MPNYWILKTEPSTYSYDDRLREKRAAWDGVKNPVGQMRPGDEVLIYHPMRLELRGRVHRGQTHDDQANAQHQKRACDHIDTMHFNALYIDERHRSPGRGLRGPSVHSLAPDETIAGDGPPVERRSFARTERGAGALL